MSEHIDRAPRHLERSTLSGALRQAGLDAVIVQSAKNVWYMSGHPRVGSSQKPGGPGAALAIGTKDGDTALVVGRWHSGLASKIAWSDTIVQFRNFSQSAFHRAADVLEAHNLRGGTIGVEMDYVSEANYLQLAGALPEATFVDAGKVVNDLRIRKGPFELEESARAYAKLSGALVAALDESHVGDTHLEIHNRIMWQILHSGTDTGRGGIALAGHAIAPLVSTKPTPTEPGDTLTLDYACSFGAYAASISRTVMIGGASAELLGAYKRQHTALLDSIAALKPGMHASQAASVIRDAYQSAGFVLTHPLLGHGVALGYEDYPVIAPGSTDELSPRMEFVLAPRAATGLQLSRRVVITPSGAESFEDGFETHQPYLLGK